METQQKYEVTTKESTGLIPKQAQVSMFLNEQRFEFAHRIATMLTVSTMVPDHFQKNVGNCMIALNLAERLDMDVVGLMQTSYIVHGRPGFEAKLPIALFNARTKLFIPPIRWEMKGDFPKGEDAACRAYAIDKETKEPLYGEWIDFDLVLSMGWLDKKGPDGTAQSNMWRSMPGQMYRYRAASFFINVYEPGLKMGIQTVDELRDMVIDVTPQREIKVQSEEKPPGDPYKVKDLKDLKSYPLQEEETPPIEPTHRRRRNLYEINGEKVKTAGIKGPVLEQIMKIGAGYPKAPAVIATCLEHHKITDLTFLREDEGKELLAILAAQIVPKDTSNQGDSGLPEDDAKIDCPEHEAPVKVTHCQTSCEKAEKCQPYQEWQHEEGIGG